MTVLSVNRFALSAVALAVMAGCSSFDPLFSGDKVDYRTQSKQTTGLEVPPDLTQLQRQAPVGAGAVSAAEFAARVKKAFPTAQTTFTIDPARARIVDSWPEDVDDSAARKDWSWSPEYGIDRAFDRGSVGACGAFAALSAGSVDSFACSGSSAASAFAGSPAMINCLARNTASSGSPGASCAARCA